MTRALLLALQHADSAFPSGSFAFSNGFEGLLERGERLDKDGLPGNLLMIIRHRWATFDRVAVVRAFRAAPSIGKLATVDLEVEATSINEPLRIGSRRNGASFVASHVRIGTPGATVLRDAVCEGTTPGHLAAVQGFLWRSVGLDEASAIAVSGYAMVAGLVTVAIRLGEIGALAAQPILRKALDHIAELALQPVHDAQPLSAFTPFLDIAAVKQSSAHIRLFAT